MESIKVCLITYGLAAVVSLFVAVLIHVMCIVIKRFAPATAPIPPAPANVSQQGGTVDVGHEVEIAIAIAAARAFEDRA